MVLSFYFLTLFLLSSSFASEIVIGDDVLKLTKENWDDALTENENVLVEFYAPWCGHCQALAPEYTKAAEKLKELNIAAKLAVVDSTKEMALSQKFKIEGYPTLKFIKNGSVTDYGGGRTADEIVEWVKRKSGPVLKQLENVEAADAFLDEGSPVTVIGFFVNEESSTVEELKAAAITRDDVSFGYSNDSAVLEKYSIKNDEIRLFKTFGHETERMVILSENLTTANIMKFVDHHELPLLSDFVQNTAVKIFKGAIPHLMFLFAPKDHENLQEIKDVYTNVSSKNIGVVRFAHVDSSNERYEKLLELFKLTKEDLPTVRLFKLGEDNLRYKMDEFSMDLEKIQLFIDDYFEGKLEPDLKMQDLPEDWDSKEVKVLVTSNFDEIVFNKENDVFVDIYAPWCQHCQAVEPIWEKVAEHYKYDPNVVIAKMDGSKNELKHMKTNGYPTLMMWRKETNKMEEYYGERQLDDFIMWIDTGKLPQKTEPLPEDWDSKPLKVLVGSNFESVALDESKHVFVMFYAPWCGHCQKLKPIWEEFAEDIKGRDDVVIAKIDATANSVANITIAAYPTMIVWKKESNEILEYAGPHEKKLFESWIDGLDETGPIDPKLGTTNDAETPAESQKQEL